MSNPNRILLIGMMGVGKTTVGGIVACRQGWCFLDSDAEIIRTTGKSVPELFAIHGEPAFRAEEARVLAEAVTSSVPMVVSVAGGALRNPDNRRMVRRAGFVVWMRASVATMAERVGTGLGRPLLGDDPFTALQRLYPERRRTYQQTADLILDVDCVDPTTVADRVIAGWWSWKRAKAAA
jgi:shikimate kinase